MSKKKKEEHSEGSIMENPDVIVSKTEEFFKDKKKRNFTSVIGGVLILAVVALFLYRGHLETQNEEAQEEMFQAVYFYEADSLSKALNGDGLNYGFLKIIGDYPGTDAANLANFYAGSIYMNLGEYKSAVRHFEEFGSSDYLVQARAYSLTGDGYMEQGLYADASKFYQLAVDYKPNESYTPVYLQKLAIAHENAGNYADAAKAYGIIIDDYFKSRLLQEAKKHKARLEGLAQ
ncbi:MAG: tetratricopeptide repeat protein [Cytophagales bacterium]|nr:tetratricopeptide repeat protein [Cytophagales bacterium]